MAQLMYGSGSPLSQLRQDYEIHQALLNAQATLVQRFLQLQAQQIADALMQHLPQVRFTLPDQVMDPAQAVNRWLYRLVSVGNPSEELLHGSSGSTCAWLCASVWRNWSNLASQLSCFPAL